MDFHPFFHQKQEKSLHRAMIYTIFLYNSQNIIPIFFRLDRPKAGDGLGIGQHNNHFVKISEIFSCPSGDSFGSSSFRKTGSFILLKMLMWLPLSTFHRFQYQVT